MLAVPYSDGVKSTLQLPADRVQEEVLNEPIVPANVKDTVPVGVVEVPADDVSVTVTVQTEAWPARTGLSHETAVLVVLRFTVRLVVPKLLV